MALRSPAGFAAQSHGPPAHRDSAATSQDFISGASHPPFETAVEIVSLILGVALIEVLSKCSEHTTDLASTWKSLKSKASKLVASLAI